MPNDSSLSRRVARLENDTEAIYELLTDVRTTLDEHTRRLDAVDGRLEGIDRHLRAVDGRFDSVDSALAEVLRRLPTSS